MENQSYFNIITNDSRLEWFWLSTKKGWILKFNNNNLNGELNGLEF